MIHPETGAPTSELEQLQKLMQLQQSGNSLLHQSSNAIPQTQFSSTALGVNDASHHNIQTPFCNPSLQIQNKQSDHFSQMELGKPRQVRVDSDTANTPNLDVLNELINHPENRMKQYGTPGINNTHIQQLQPIFSLQQIPLQSQSGNQQVDVTNILCSNMRVNNNTINKPNTNHLMQPPQLQDFQKRQLLMRQQQVIRDLERKIKDNRKAVSTQSFVLEQNDQIKSAQVAQHRVSTQLHMKNAGLIPKKHESTSSSDENTLLLAPERDNSGVDDPVRRREISKRSQRSKLNQVRKKEPLQHQRLPPPSSRASKNRIKEDSPKLKRAKVGDERLEGKSKKKRYLKPEVVGSKDQKRGKNVVEKETKLIQQQQQRLMILRHASKCKLGSSCNVRYCSQMVSLWNHMKKCRNKDCKTPHCLSSRMVLNHYRMCKRKGTTATCKVCGPLYQPKETNDIEPPNEQKSDEYERARQNLLQQKSRFQQLRQQQLELTEKQKSLQREKELNLQEKPEVHQELQRQQVYLNTLQLQLQHQMLQLEEQCIKDTLKSGRNSKDQPPFCTPIDKPKPKTPGDLFPLLKKANEEAVRRLKDTEKSDILTKCLPIIRDLINNPSGWVFKDPVDPVVLKLPDYFDVITKPMDLSLVEKRLLDSYYNDIGEFRADTRLVFENALLYNGADSEVGEIATKLLKRFETHFEKIETISI